MLGLSVVGAQMLGKEAGVRRKEQLLRDSEGQLLLPHEREEPVDERKGRN